MVDDGSCVTGVWFRDSDFVTLPENCWFPCCVCMAITGKRFHKANTVIFIGDYWAYEMIDHGGSMVTVAWYMRSSHPIVSYRYSARVATTFRMTILMSVIPLFCQATFEITLH